MIRKIVSGGQTGADRAALDVALALGISHGGWITKDRKTESGPLPERYQLQEIDSNSYAARTEKNVKDSDGTLILSHGRPTGGSALSSKFAAKHNRPWLHIDLKKTAAFRAAEQIRTWIEENDIEILNVAGPRASKDPYIYQDTVALLETVFHMQLIQIAPPGSAISPDAEQDTDLPATLDEAVEQILSTLSFREKTKIARMPQKHLIKLNFSLGKKIQRQFGLHGENQRLLDSCRRMSGGPSIHPDQASFIIIMELWDKLQTANVLRVIK
jgi:hypothetical protein